MNDSLYYGDYLQLDKLLSAQLPESERVGTPVHDEMLFIIVHQVYELWFKQLMHELASVQAIFKDDELDDSDLFRVVSRLERMSAVVGGLTEPINILETMSPMDFLEFRDLLAPASGFQSVQFRMVENKLGLRSRNEYGNVAYFNRLKPEDQKRVKDSEKEPSLLDGVDSWLGRTPFLESDDFSFWESYRKSVDSLLEREEIAISQSPTLTDAERTVQHKKLDLTRQHFAALFDQDKHEALVKSGDRRLSLRATQAALLIFLYRDQPVFQIPYKVLSTLIDIDERLTNWRYKHALLVFRMIGNKLGTGGSSGYDYLKMSAEKHKIFGDLANLSTFIIPRSSLPQLPEKLRKRLGFFYKDGVK